jgi:hypothetical protein
MVVCGEWESGEFLALTDRRSSECSRTDEIII